jgi:hypothetical protein
MRRWIPHRDKQEDFERDIKTQDHRIVSVRLSRMQ